MDAIIEARVIELRDQVVAVCNYIDATVNWLSETMNKRIDGNSIGDRMACSLFGGGLLGMSISKIIRIGKKTTKVIYGMTEDDMGQDAVNQDTKQVDYQEEKTLEKMIRRQCLKQICCLGLNEDTCAAVEINHK